MRLTFGFGLVCLLLAFGNTLRGEETLDVDPAKPMRLILHVCQSDGVPLRPLVDDTGLRNKYDRQGTPDVSSDGSKVAFDAWSLSGSGDWQDAMIIVVNFDGSEATAVSDGVMPSFSPDAKRLCISRPAKHAKQEGARGQSLWLMNVDGSDKEMIADRGAWGGRWSPDGRSIVFHGGVDDSGAKLPTTCLRLYDIETKTTRLVFSPAESPFSRLVHHFEWALQGRRVAFGGSLKGGSTATGVIDVDKGIDSLQIITDDRVGHGMTYDWHPDGERLLVMAQIGDRVSPYFLSTNKDAPSSTITGIPLNAQCHDLCVHPDGKHLIASLRSR